MLVWFVGNIQHFYAKCTGINMFKHSVSNSPRKLCCSIILQNLNDFVPYHQEAFNLVHYISRMIKLSLCGRPSSNFEFFLTICF